MDDLRKRSSYIYVCRQCFVAAGVTINMMAHGCVIGFPAILIPGLRQPGSLIKATSSEESWIASILGIALVLGNIIISLIMNTLGRKKSHLLTILPISIGWFTLLLVNSVSGLIVARFLQGISIGILGLLAAIIIGETSDPKNRGALLTSISLALSLGNLFSHTIGSIISWQQTALVCSFITFTSLCLIIFAPETPPWLASKGRFEESREMFKWLRGSGEKQEDELHKMIQARIIARKSSLSEKDISFSKRMKRCFSYFGMTYRKPEFYKPIIIMLHLYTMFQFSGVNVLSAYAMDILKELISPEVQPYWMIILDVVRLVANLLAVVLMKVMKRRTLLFTAGVICVISYALNAAYLIGKHYNLLPSDSHWIPIVIIVMHMASMSAGISSITFAIPGEIFPLEYRGLGGGMSIIALSFNMFIVLKCFPLITGLFGMACTFLVYATVVVYCLFVVWLTLPETKDKTLQEIEDTFRGNVSVDDAKSLESLKIYEVK